MSLTTERRVWRGSILTFLGEALVFPFGLAILYFLAHRLSPEDFGYVTMITTFIAWLEATIAVILHRASVKAILDAGAERPDVEAGIFWIHGILGLVAGGALACLAGMAEARPGLLRIAALSLPFIAAATAHRTILFARGEFRTRPLLNGVRWSGRLICTILFVGVGWGAEGALGALVAGSGLELLMARVFARPGFQWLSGRWKILWGSTWPVLLASVSLRIVDRLDFFMLMAVESDAAILGSYGAASNIALIFVMSSSVLATTMFPSIHAVLKEGRREEEAAVLIRQVIRWVLWMLPAAALVAGAASEITSLLLGPVFSEAAFPLALLLFSAILWSLFQIVVSVLTALERPFWLLGLTLPVPVLAGAVLLLSIRAAGLKGAAAGMLLVSAMAAVGSMAVLRRHLPISFPVATFLRCGGLALAGGWASATWPFAGAWVIVKLGVLLVLGAAILAMLGEFRRERFQ